MNTLDYWNKAALDPDVDVKYICDIDASLCMSDLDGLDGKVLEIGCGVGRLMKSKQYGVDLSSEMIKLAKQRRPDCNFYVASGELPFDDETFDATYCYLLFQHLKINEIATYIGEAYRVLKPKGKFVFQFIEGTEQEPLSNHYDKHVIEGLLRVAGFSDFSSKASKAHKMWTIMEGIK